MRKVDLGGIAGAIGLITFAIQQGCTVTGSLSWIAGVAWFGFATVSTISGVWFWDGAKRLTKPGKLVTSVLIVLLFGSLSYAPIRDQRRRELAGTPPLVNVDDLASELGKKIKIPTPTVSALRKQAFDLSTELNDFMSERHALAMEGLDRTGKTSLTEKQTERVYRIYGQAVAEYQSRYKKRILGLLREISTATGKDTSALEKDVAGVQGMALGSVKGIADRIAALAGALP